MAVDGESPYVPPRIETPPLARVVLAAWRGPSIVATGYSLRQQEQFAELVEASLPALLVSSLEYVKTAENEYGESELSDIRNAVSALFLIENTGFENFADRFENILKLVNNEDESMARRFFPWLLNYLQGNDILLDDVTERVNGLLEGKYILATSIQKSRQRWMQVGMRQSSEIEKSAKARRHSIFLGRISVMNLELPAANYNARIPSVSLNLRILRTPRCHAFVLLFVKSLFFTRVFLDANYVRY